MCIRDRTDAPGEIYVVGGHYDCYASGNPYILAPGVDDNGSAVAATLEIARVLKLHSVALPATVRFSLFAAEELGLFGSAYLAEKAREAGDDIRYVFNMDMIANNPDSINEVTVWKYPGDEWAAYLAAEAFDAYTDITVNVSSGYMFGGSDSYSYFLQGYPAIFLQEAEFSSVYHTPGDTVGQSNMEYCAENARGICAGLLCEEFRPQPQHLKASSGKTAIGLTWDSTANTHITGYNVYRGSDPDSLFTCITPEPVPSTTYSDSDIEARREYYYFVTSISDILGESFPSTLVSGALFRFTDTLLVINTLPNEAASPDSIRNFYAAILDTIPFRWFDFTPDHLLQLKDLASYRNVLWMNHGLTVNPYFRPDPADLSSFFSNGGNMLVAGFLPMAYVDGITGFPVKLQEGMVLHDFFKADSMNKKITALMYRAYPSAPGYDTLAVDPAKVLIPGHPGELLNVETYTPAPEGKVIYRFDCYADSTSPQGIMKNHPVGLEYMGDEYKTILLSFPLYYIDTADARAFLQNAMKYKFNSPTSIPEGSQANRLKLSLFPNPSTGNVRLTVRTGSTGAVRITVLNMQGKDVLQRQDRAARSDGTIAVDLNLREQAPGLYQVIVSGGGRVATGKLLIVR
jgi:hypothetical protein